MNRVQKGLKLFIKDVKSAIPASMIFVIYTVVAKTFFARYCPFVMVTGLPCAGCGMTRATILFLSGKFVQSLVMHPMVLSFGILAFAYCLFKYVLFIDTRTLKSAFIFILAATILVYILRMFLYFPTKVPMVYYENNLISRLLDLINSK